MPPEFDHAAWRNKHFSFATEMVPKWAAAVRDRFGGSSATTKYACVGYCFGAPFVCGLLAGDLVSAGAFAHPVPAQGGALHGTEASVPLQPHRAWSSLLTALRLQTPLLLSCAEGRQGFSTRSPRRTAVDLLQSHGKKYHVQLSQGVSHGFAVKGDPEDPYQRE